MPQSLSVLLNLSFWFFVSVVVVTVLSNAWDSLSLNNRLALKRRLGIVARILSAVGAGVVLAWALAFLYFVLS